MLPLLHLYITHRHWCLKICLSTDFLFELSFNARDKLTDFYPRVFFSNCFLVCELFISYGCITRFNIKRLAWIKCVCDHDWSLKMKWPLLIICKSLLRVHGHCTCGHSLYTHYSSCIHCCFDFSQQLSIIIVLIYILTYMALYLYFVNQAHIYYFKFTPFHYINSLCTAKFSYWLRVCSCFLH